MLQRVSFPDDAQDDQGVVAGGIAADRLRSIIERVERLGEERKALSGDIRDISRSGSPAGSKRWQTGIAICHAPSLPSASHPISERLIHVATRIIS